MARSERALQPTTTGLRALYQMKRRRPGYPTRLMVNLCRPVHAASQSAMIWDAKARRLLCPTE
jgi:hypothetical protein